MYQEIETFKKLLSKLDSQDKVITTRLGEVVLHCAKRGDPAAIEAITSYATRANYENTNKYVSENLLKRMEVI